MPSFVSVVGTVSVTTTNVSVDDGGLIGDSGDANTSGKSANTNTPRIFVLTPFLKTIIN